MMNLTICITCYIAFLFLYSVIIIAIEATSFIVGLTFVILPFLCYILLNRFAIPKPSDSFIDEILGVNLWQAQKDKSSLFDEIENQSADETFVIRTIGHRACGLDAPENSIPAMELCKNKGLLCIEVDLWLTADNVPVVFHDPTVDRMTDGTGIIYQKTFEDLRKLKIVFQPQIDAQHNFSDVRIPTLDECLAICFESNMKIILDIKDARDEMVNVLLKTYKKHPRLYTMAIVSSFNAITLYKLRSADPKIVCSIAWRPEFCTSTKYDPFNGSKRWANSPHRHYFALLMDIGFAWLFDNILYYLIGVSVVLLHKDAISGRTVAKWQNRGIRVMAWTVNTKTEKDYLANILRIPYLTDTLEYTH